MDGKIGSASRPTSESRSTIRTSLTCGFACSLANSLPVDVWRNDTWSPATWAELEVLHCLLGWSVPSVCGAARWGTW